MADKTKILFVCLGNICRSPAAEGIMQHIVDKRGMSGRIEVDSAGTYGGHAGEPADRRMREAARARGYDLTSRSRKIRMDDFFDFDMIIVMDDSNYDDVHSLAPDIGSTEKIHRMTDLCKTHKVTYVPDPYYGGRNGFENVLDILEDACGRLLEKITEGLD